jgi:hypothetical protein
MTLAAAPVDPAIPDGNVVKRPREDMVEERRTAISNDMTPGPRRHQISDAWGCGRPVICLAAGVLTI